MVLAATGLVQILINKQTCNDCFVRFLAGSSNGRILGSVPRDPGSNPGPATNFVQ